MAAGTAYTDHKSMQTMAAADGRWHATARPKVAGHIFMQPKRFLVENYPRECSAGIGMTTGHLTPEQTFLRPSTVPKHGTGELIASCRIVDLGVEI